MNSPTESQLRAAFQMAIQEAQLFVGATAPNPPVGAAALDSSGQILSVQAHQKAGTPHAEALVIHELRSRGILDRVHTFLVTLEPCNHFGRTPPCTEGILATPARRVIFGAKDPNPKVAGGGEKRLQEAGIETSLVDDAELRRECEKLIEPFAYWSKTGLPYVTVKTAYTTEGSMIPPLGRKTFTSPASLKFAHELRKRADAILTGSGTVLTDDPLFTIRHVPDHPGKKRWLVILDRSHRVTDDWVEKAQDRGFRVMRDLEFEDALRFLGKNGVLEVLVEAGPQVSASVLASSFWNRHVLITQGAPEDTITERRANREG